MAVKVAFVLDVSGSMSSIQDEMANAVNSMVDTIEKQDKDTQALLTRFDSFVDEGELDNISKFPKKSRYGAGSMTALFDGVGASIEALGKSKKDNYLVLVFTDGHENASTKFNAQNISKLIKDREALGNWTITFQLPPGSANDFCSRFGISRGNVTEWEATKAGVTKLESVTTSSIQGYYTALASGSRSVKNFYNMTTDMSNVTTKDVKAALVDQKKNFKVIKVDKEADIRPFVESKTGTPYVKGSAYYQLTKPEKVQPNKDILIMEKGKSNIWGGMPGRALIGLPTDGITYSKVNPGNHANYDIFVKSNSVNRKLVRGTTLLVKV